MSDLDLFGGLVPTGPPPSDPILLLLVHAAYLIDRGHDDGIGAPEVGLRKATVRAAVGGGWAIQCYVGDSDTEQGPRRLRLTDEGRAHAENAPPWMSRIVRESYEVNS